VAAIPEPKNCAYCGREMAYRKKWEKNWAEVKFCSDRCRGDARRNKGQAQNLEALILVLLRERGAGKTICPSEVLPMADRQNKELMESVRQAARRLCHQGEIEIVQKGAVVDPSEFRGPIRLRKKNKSG